MLWTCKPFGELSATEIYTILHLRNEVFIVEQNCPYQDCDFKDLKAWHLMGTEDDNLIAYTRLLPQGYPYAEASIGRVVTSPQARKRGLGRELMNESIHRVASVFGTALIRIGAQRYLKNFYESFGFVQQGEGYLEDGIPHIIMLRQHAEIPKNS